jgi:hypothetical protein
VAAGFQRHVHHAAAGHLSRLVESQYLGVVRAGRLGVTQTDDDILLDHDRTYRRVRASLPEGEPRQR